MKLLGLAKGKVTLWRSEGLALNNRVKERDTGGKPPLIGTRNWILPAPPPVLGGGRWLFWVEINGYEPDFVPGP